MLRVAPGGTVPRAQGKAVVQSPAVLTKVRPAGVGSLTTTFAALDGPALLTWIVYTSVAPGTTFAGPVLVMLTSALGTSVLTSVLLADDGSDTPAGGVMVAVLTSVPIAAAEMVPLAVNVTVPPGGRSTSALILPAPAAGQAAPPAAAQVHVTPVMSVGKLSVTVAPRAALGPAFVAVMVYVIGAPGTLVAEPSVLVMERSATGDPADVDAIAVLLPSAGSVVVVVAVTTCWMGSGPAYSAGTA